MNIDEETTADDLLQRREELREAGVEISVEELTLGASDEVRAEVFARLARIEAAERAVGATWWWMGGDDGSLQPLGVDGRFVDPEIRQQGGMGYLCAARDVELNRVVAYKVMKATLGSDSVARDHFFNEAVITSRLNHPGVVPVYGRVIDDSGLPAYASAFVSGRTLASMIEDYRKLGQDARGPRAEALATLLKSFLDTCDVVAYAHSRKIVHGDVKPLNILSDDFGATRLVDWGLARTVDDDEPAVEENPTHRAGTLPFLSTTEGRSSYFSDIYALGLTLAMILGENAGESTFRLQRAADTPKALWAVAEQAMQLDRALRYTSVTQLADDVRAVLADRAVAVYADPWTTKVRRGVVRNLPAVVGAGVLLFVFGVGGPVVGFRENGLRLRADASRIRAVELTHAMLDQADHVGKLQATLPGSHEMLDRAVSLIEQLARDAEEAGDDQAPAAESYYRAGRINQVLGRLDGAADCFRKAAELAERSLRTRPGDDHASDLNRKAEALRDLGVIQAMRGRVDEANSAWREAIEVLKPVATRSPEHRLTHARILYAFGNGRMILGDQPRAQTYFAEARAILEPLVQAPSPDLRSIRALADVYSNLGFSLFHLAAPDGISLANPAKLVEAKRAHADALRLRRGLVKSEPGSPERVADVAASLNLLGNASQVEGPSSQAAAAGYYGEAASLLKSLVVAFPSVQSQRRELAQVYSNLNVLLASSGRLEEARASSSSAVELFSFLVEHEAESPELLADLGVALTQQARTLGLIGDGPGSSSTGLQAAEALARAASMFGDPARRRAFGDQAIAILVELNRQGYFRDGQAAERLAGPSFAVLRDREDFPKP